MIIPRAGFDRHLQTTVLSWKSIACVGAKAAAPAIASNGVPASLVQPTKTLHFSVHGALAFTRGASCSIKSRDPTDIYERSGCGFRHAAGNSQCSEQK